MKNVRVWERNTERDFGRVLFWQGSKNGWKLSILPQHWLGGTRCVSVRKWQKKRTGAHHKRPAVCMLFNNADSAFLPNIFAFQLFFAHLLSVLNQNIFVAQGGNKPLKTVSHEYRFFYSFLLHLFVGACHLTCIQSPPTVKKLFQPVILPILPKWGVDVLWPTLVIKTHAHKRWYQLLLISRVYVKVLSTVCVYHYCMCQHMSD